MPKPLILFLDTAHPSLAEKLSCLGFGCDNASGWDQESIMRNIGRYEGIVIRSRMAIDKKFIDKAESLRFIARAGSGMENIDVKYASLKGIACINAPEGNRDSVAEHALGMLLSLLNRINKADREVRRGLWKRESNRGSELGGKTVAIIGCGNTGAAFAKRINAFDVKVLMYDKDPARSQTSLEDIYSQADVVSLHVPHTAETHYLVNDVFINRFKKNFYLINTSRGQIVNTDDLVKNMMSGKILGACLDVLEHESASFEELKGMGFWFNKRGIFWNDLRRWLYRRGIWKYTHSIEYLASSDNVVLTPHVAGWTVESYEKIAKTLAEKIEKFVAESNQVPAT